MAWYNINNVMTTINGYPLSYIEFWGTITGLISVWLATRSNIWTWPTGLINVICFFIIFFQVRLYADMFLQVYFFVTSIYGWVIWYNHIDVKNIYRMSISNRIKLMVLILILTLVCGIIVKNIHLIFPSVFIKPASFPFVDSFVAINSIVATILLAKQKLENWFLWILVDIISVILYAEKMVLFISIEYFIFLCLAIAGLFMWLKTIRNEEGLSIR